MAVAPLIHRDPTKGLHSSVHSALLAIFYPFLLTSRPTPRHLFFGVSFRVLFQSAVLFVWSTSNGRFPSSTRPSSTHGKKPNLDLTTVVPVLLYAGEAGYRAFANILVRCLRAGKLNGMNSTRSGKPFPQHRSLLRSLSLTVCPRFYVDIHTKRSQWEKPTQPVYPPDRDSPPPGGPPGYVGSDHFSNVSDKKSNPYDDHRGAGSASPNNIDEDARLAARLQAEEDARAQQSRGNAYQDYVNTSLPPQSSPAQLPPREEKRGLFSKLLGKSNSNQQPRYGQPGYGGGYQQGGYPPQQGYPPQEGYGGYPPQQGYPPQGGYGGYPPQGYGGYPPQGGYGGYPPQGGYGGYPQQGYAQEPPKKSGLGGLGAVGGAGLGLAGGLVGGMLIEDAIQNNDQNEYDQGYGRRIPRQVSCLPTNLK